MPLAALARMCGIKGTCSSRNLETCLVKHPHRRVLGASGAQSVREVWLQREFYQHDFAFMIMFYLRVILALKFEVMRQGVSEALFLRSMLLEAQLAKKVNVIAHADSTAGKSMATRFGTGKKKARGTEVLVCAESGANGFATNGRIDGTRNPADLMTKYVATDVLQRLKSQLGVVSNWFKGNVDSDAHMTDDHVAALNAHCTPRPSALTVHSLHCACVYSACAVRACFSRRRRIMRIFDGHTVQFQIIISSFSSSFCSSFSSSFHF